MNPQIESALERLGQRWGCTKERATHRVLVLSLTGWSTRYADLIERLSRFVPSKEDPVRRTCYMLRHHFDKTEVELGEAVRECDRVAWLETLFDTLKDRAENGDRAMLLDLLADGSAEAGA